MTRACVYCGGSVNPTDFRYGANYRRVVGWERKTRTRSSGAKGGSDIALRESRDEWACRSCVEKRKLGLAPGQQGLL
jgi:hypothetical protein